MPLDADTARLAKSKNLATVVTLMPNGQPQAQLTWIDTDGENLLVEYRAGTAALKEHPPGSPHHRAAALQLRRLGLGRGSRPGDRHDRRSEGQGSHRRTGERCTWTAYSRPVGPDGRVILVIKPDKINTPRSRGIR